MTKLQDIALKSIDGSDVSLGDFAGKVLLVVNVASKCGLTPQYEALENVYETYRDKGVEVLGFPANDFGAQEPGTDSEIQSFCTSNFGVEFPMFSKIAVTGVDQHSLYKELTARQPKAISASGKDDFREKLAGHGMTPNPEPGILWNFEKFLVSREGEVVARFSPDTAPNDPLVIKAIEAVL